MSNDLMRFSVAMPEDLLVKFDHLVARRGLAKNRSEVVRDLVREALVVFRAWANRYGYAHYRVQPPRQRLAGKIAPYTAHLFGHGGSFHACACRSRQLP